MVFFQASPYSGIMKESFENGFGKGHQMQMFS
jgi:hypothetical protein